MLSFPVFTCKTHIISNPASRRHTVIYHLYTQLSCTQTHKCNCLGFCPENTHPTLTRPHAHVFALMETHFEHKIFWKILSALPLCLGGPGSGKGTQCMKIAERYGFHYVSVGELLRKKMIHNATSNRKWSLIAKIITNGELAPQVGVCVLVLVTHWVPQCSFY